MKIKGKHSLVAAKNVGKSVVAGESYFVAVERFCSSRNVSWQQKCVVAAEEGTFFKYVVAVKKKFRDNRKKRRISSICYTYDIIFT